MTPDEISEEKKADEIRPLAEREEAFADAVFRAVLGAQLCQTAYLGSKLGWYDELATAGEAGLTSVQLASNTFASSRYAREWLEQQSVAGWIRCENPKAPQDQRRFVIPEAHINVLTNKDSLSYLLPAAVFQANCGKHVDSLVDAYKNNTGVSWQTFGDDAREQEAAANRPFYLNSLANKLESCLDAGAANKLKTQGGRIVDVGAGCCWSSIGVAKHFPASKIEAFDIDKPSVQAAQKNIQNAGLQDRVVAHCADAATLLDNDHQEPCDLVLALECIHDLADPISVLRTMKGLAAGQGTVVVMDENVAEEFSDALDNNPVEQAFYGFSCTCCLADGKSHPSSSETGAVMRPKLLRAYAQQAGFKDIEIMPTEKGDFFRFYKLI